MKSTMRLLLVLMIMMALGPNSCQAKNNDDDDDKKNNHKGKDDDDDKKNDNKNDNKGKKTPNPTPFPTMDPSIGPSSFPSETFSPTTSRSPDYTGAPVTPQPTPTPSTSPSTSLLPTVSAVPSLTPSVSPSLSFEPSYSPTSLPSTSPSATPSFIPSASPTLSSAPSAAPWTYDRPPRLDIRYLPWIALNDSIKEIAENLEYDSFTWENYGTNDVEYYGWDDLPLEYQGNASELGYDQRSWDCWQNHYESYRWIDLPTTHIQVFQFFDALGYDINYWNGYTNVTTSDADQRMWYDLSSEERHAAAQLCFIRRSWNEEEVLYSNMFPMVKPAFRFVAWDEMEEEKRVAAVKLGYENVTWNVLGLATVEERPWNKLITQERNAATNLGWTDITWDCWINHFTSYSWDELQLYSLDVHYLALGWNVSSWNKRIDPPSSHGKYWDLLNDIERENANALCYFRDSWDRIDMSLNNGPFPFRLPSKRYVPWKTLANADRQRAYDSLFYDECTWDVYGVADIEMKEWRDLTPWEKLEATKLGFIPNSWDCFQTHYTLKSWYDINWDIRDAMSVLGWDEDSWSKYNETTDTNMALPESYGKKWESLSKDEQEAAYKICYFNVNWPGGTEATVEEVELFIEEVERNQTLVRVDSISSIMDALGSNGLDAVYTATLENGSFCLNTSPVMTVSLSLLLSIAVATLLM